MATRKNPGGRYVRARTVVDNQLAVESKYAPKRVRGPAANVRARGAFVKRNLAGSPFKNAGRRGS